MKYDLMSIKPVSKSNLLAFIETGLRAFGAIDESMEVVDIKIPYSGLNTDKPKDNVGVQIYYKRPIREEDITFKHYGKGKKL